MEAIVTWVTAAGLVAGAVMFWRTHRAWAIFNALAAVALFVMELT